MQFRPIFGAKIQIFENLASQTKKYYFGSEHWNETFLGDFQTLCADLGLFELGWMQQIYR